ncbi:enoyl-CoA hydratase/isomerase family protein [Kribbella sp. NPDC056951]|uniref:enoyl-CoA hydratase/isomerase family protein n=1 Tax=Kribbella sp. NPDC056951 TaxID=3345978 RepID=UPI00362649AB
MPDGIRLKVRAGAAEIMIDRPAAGNTLDSRALAALARALLHVEQAADVHCAVLRSGVEGVFCSGGNYADADRPGRASRDYAPSLAACFEAWTGRSFPVIAVVDGAARAFGAALALTSDLVVATPRASFGLPELSRGVVPSYAIALLRTRHSSQFVRELVFTTEPITARSDLATVSNDPEQVVRAHVERFASIGADAVRAAQRLLNAIDAAVDLPTAQQLAVDGVAEQLRRYDEGRADQSYLGL